MELYKQVNVECTLKFSTLVVPEPGFDFIGIQRKQDRGQKKEYIDSVVKLVAQLNKHDNLGRSQ